MKMKKKVSNKEIIDSLKDSIKKNNLALEYVSLEKQRNEDLLKYNEKDVVAKENYENLAYIEFTLSFVGNQYSDALKKRGVILV